MSGVDETPWICPSCAHFTVRQGEVVRAPTHDCSVAGLPVDLVHYVDSDQALAIRNNVSRTSTAPATSRSLR